MISKLRRDCATCGHDVSLHHSAKVAPCQRPGCSCSDFKRPTKGARRVKLDQNGATIKREVNL